MVCRPFPVETMAIAWKIHGFPTCFVGDRGARWLSKSGKQQLPGSGEFLQYQRIGGDPAGKKKGEDPAEARYIPSGKLT